MKTAGQIHQKLKQVRFRRVKKELAKLTKRAGRNCVNQTVVTSPSGPLGVCKLDCATCDSLVRDRAVGCDDFQPNHTPEQLKESLQVFFDTREPNEVAVRFPDVAALLWVLSVEGDPQAGPLFPDGHSTRPWLGIDVWADSEEEVEALKSRVKDFEAATAFVQQACAALEVDPEEAQGKITSLKDELETIAIAFAVQIDLLAKVDGEKKNLESENERLNLCLEQAEKQGFKADDGWAVVPAPPKPWWRRLLG